MPTGPSIFRSVRETRAVNMPQGGCGLHTRHSQLFTHTFIHLSMGVEHLLIVWHYANLINKMVSRVLSLPRGAGTLHLVPI